MFCKWSPRDYSPRLGNSILRYDGIPYRVEVNDDREIYLRDLSTNRNVCRVTLPDERFDISTPPHGYVNFEEQCLYLDRAPVRSYKQGLDTRNSSFYSIPLQEDRAGVANGMMIFDGRRVRDDGRMLFSKYTKKMMLGEYPSTQSVLAGLRKGQFRQRAISREVAFAIDPIGMISVFYRQSLVGHIIPDQDIDIIRVPAGGIHAQIISENIQGFGIEVQ